jgi:hypothetical protein
LAVQIGGDMTKTATVVKGNDQVDGALTAFSAEEICIGMDEDGEPLTAAIISASIPTVHAPTAKRSAKQELALNALDRAVRDHGCVAPQGVAAPPWAKVAKVDHWREELLRCGVVRRDLKNPRSAFKKLKDALAEGRHIFERDGYVWPAGPGSLPTLLSLVPVTAAAINLPPPPEGMVDRKLPLPPFPATIV